MPFSLSNPELIHCRQWLYGNIGLQQCFDILCHVQRRRGGLKAFYHVAFFVNQEFREIPFDAVPFQVFREVRLKHFFQFRGNRMLLIKTFKAFFFCQKLKQRLCRFATHIAFFKNLKSYPVIETAELFNGSVAFRILFRKLVTGEA